MAKKSIKVTQLRSLAGIRFDHRATMRGLGLRRIRHSVILQDTPEVRGMIHKVDYMIKVEESA